MEKSFFSNDFMEGADDQRFLFVRVQFFPSDIAQYDIVRQIFFKLVSWSPSELPHLRRIHAVAQVLSGTVFDEHEEIFRFAHRAQDAFYHLKIAPDFSRRYVIDPAIRARWANRKISSC